MVYTVEVGVAVEDLYRDITTVDYWRDLVVFYREHGTTTEIAHFASGTDGTEVTFAHILSGADLPPVARPVLPGTFVVTREQHFGPLHAVRREALGTYRALVPTVPVDITGEYVLEQSGSGSRMRLETTCTVRVPIIGGQIETLIVNGLRTLFDTEGEFTEQWVAGHRR
jgi:hypothetical protein